MLASHERVDYAPETRFRTARRRDKQFQFSWHYHPEYEITLVMNGAGWRYLGNTVEAYTGPELVLIPPELPHSWVSEPGKGLQEAFVLQFNRSCLGDGFFESPDFCNGREIYDRHHALVFSQDVARLALPVMERFMLAEGLERIGCFIEITRLLAEASSRHLSFDSYRPSLDKVSQEKVSLIIDWIQHRTHDQITAAEAAAFLNMSESTFRRFFKRNTGKSLISFVNETRIHHVCRRLAVDRVPVSEAALDAGFNNLAHFNRLFLRQTGITPREFKRRQSR